MTWEEYKKELNKVGLNATVDNGDIITIYDDSKDNILAKDNILVFSVLDRNSSAEISFGVTYSDIKTMSVVINATEKLINTPYEKIHFEPVYRLVWDNSVADPLVLGYNVRRKTWKLDYDTNLQQAGFQTMFSSDTLDKIAGDNADLIYKMNALKEKV